MAQEYKHQGRWKLAEGADQDGLLEGSCLWECLWIN